MRTSAAVCTCVIVAACHRNASNDGPNESRAAANGRAATLRGASATDSGLAPARCTLGDAAATLADVGDRRSLVMGDAVPTADGLALGLVHSPASGTEAVVVRITGNEVASAWVVARGALLIADAPPPKPLVSGTALYAVAVETGPRSSDAGPSAPERRIVLQKAGAPEALASYPERADESLSFDAALSTDGAAAALAWDEDAAIGGGVTVGVVPLANPRALPARVVSVGTEDPELPRLAPRKDGGWWAFWIARHAESPGDAGPSAAAAIEAPAEPAGVAWLEFVAVDPSGAPLSGPRRLTSPTGHVASFDVAARADGELCVVIRDETQEHEGEGGRILHLTLRADGTADPPVTLATGAGRGSVDVFAGDGRDWIAFTDAQDRSRVAPLALTGDGALAGPPSVEAALDAGRLLALVKPAKPSEPAAVAFLAAFPSGDGALFREVSCTP